MAQYYRYMIEWTNRNGQWIVGALTVWTAAMLMWVLR